MAFRAEIAETAEMPPDSHLYLYLELHADRTPGRPQCTFANRGLYPFPQVAEVTAATTAPQTAAEKKHGARNALADGVS